MTSATERVPAELDALAGVRDRLAAALAAERWSDDAAIRVMTASTEALANALEHAAAEHAWVELHHRDDLLTVLVGDDGRGGADPAAGTGLRGVARRLAALDGTVRVSSPSGGPTLVTLEVPCSSSSPRTTPSSGTA